MAIGRINGPMLSSNLERQGINLAIDANVAYFDVTNRRVGINNSSPGYNLDVTGNARLGNLYIFGNTISSDTGANIAGNVSFSGTINATNPFNGTIAVAGGVGIAQDLWVGGNVYAGSIVSENISILNVSDPLLYLSANTPYPYNYELGFYSHFVGGTGNVYQHSGLVRNHSDNYWYLFSNTPEPAGGTVNLGNSWVILDTLKAGAAIFANSTVSTSTTSGALVVTGGAGIGGSLYITNTGDVSANIGNILVSTQILNANVTAYEAWANAAIGNIQSNVSSTYGNTIILGSNTVQALISNAVSLTTTTKVTDAIAALNYVLGKLVPPSPPNFPNNTSISVATSNSGLMCNFVQTDNSGWGNLSVTGGTLVNTVRASSFSTSGTAVTNVGPGSSGTVTAYVNGTPNGNVTLNGSNSNTTNGNVYVYNVQDYHAVVSTVTAGFWTVFSAYATATAGILAGWNRVSIYDSATGTSTNQATWYYDNASPTAPAFSGTSMVLSSNVVTYSSTIPMFTSSAGFTLIGNVRNISGDTYPNSTYLIGTTGGTAAFAAPALVSYTTAGVTTPITRNNTAIIAFTTTANINSGFGNVTTSSNSPSVTVNNGYNSTAVAFQAPSTYLLYKTGTGNQIEETSLTIAGSVGSGSGNPYRIVNPDAGTQADTPSYTGSEAAFNSTTGLFYQTDATNVGAKLQYDVTNYSSGFLPVGPNLSARSTTAQYFTFKFVRSAVSKFNISYSGTIAGLWVALPGSTIDSTSGLNGWLTMGTAYPGSGVPGSGGGGNGSNGCAVGGTAIFNSLVSGGSYTCTFGTVSSSSTATNEIYVRVKMTSGQNLTALSIQAATN